MQPVFLHDKAEIEHFLRRETALHLYELGDLDDFFWPFTTWIAAREDGQIRAVMLLYSGMGLPVLLALAGEGREWLRRLAEAAARQPLLPRRFYAHLSPGLADTFAGAGFRLAPHGRFLKMSLTEPARLESADAGRAVRLGPADAPLLRDLYEDAYPDNSFDPRMLETGCFYGIHLDGKLASAAGVHVFSPAYRVAALGSIATRPKYRGGGLGAAVTAALCRALRGQVDHIGLNVRADNTPAAALYTRLGFTPAAEYEEYMVEAV